MILNGPTPRAPEAERYFVACALLDPGGLDDLDPPVRPEHLQDGWLRRCFEAVEALRKASAPVNPVSVYDAMRRLGEHDNDAYRIACTTDTVVELSESVPTSANLAYYASEVLGAHVSRRLAVVAHQIGQLAQHSAKPAREKLDEAEQLLLALTTDNSERVQLTNASQLSDLVYEHLRRVTRLDQQSGVRTGLEALDDILAGLQPGELTLIAARPSSGKTALASNILRRCAQEGERVVFISLETPARQLGINWLAAKAYVDTRRLRDGTLDVHGDRLPAKVVDRLYEIADVGDHLTIADRGVRTVGDVRRLARRAQRNGCSIVCVDYLQLLTDDVRHRNSYDEVSAISRQLKAIAVDCGLHVLALAQLNRANEERTSKRPRMSDLRGSGQLEQDADAIVLVHRPHYYDTKADPQLCELIVAKNRNGPTGTARVRFLRQFNLMKPYEDHASKEGEAE